MVHEGSFKEGNNAAEKWTEETVMPYLDRIKEYSKEPKCYWLGSALVKEGLYKDIWSYWKEKFKDNEYVLLSIKAIDLIFEDKLYGNSLMGNYNPATAIFGLKNNYDWKDKQEIEQTHHIDDLKSTSSQLFRNSDTDTGIS